ncbi:multiubiquitin domain-containing protein [Clavibacter californiensis]|uniref:Multi-ubiquitin domain-containing protein n=1 Tax=Clavibacter californiensis TaxID=1401995 RepID=A0ABX9N9I7_9MICO|nr:multiubiquitin domain-containing protein [Clavibacter californiensis]RII94890.1 hypothetical protein DZF98_00275 [Clavibacter californiensis]UKF81720.1 multiubiquitin domain-containing protein [Clavibacter californiensis]
MVPALPTPLTIDIDGKGLRTSDYDQDAASLMRLAGRDPKIFDLFLVTEHGIEEPIRDIQIVNLTDGMRFVTRINLRFTIDGQPFSTYDDDQTASSLLLLAGVAPAQYDLARVRPNGQTESFRDEEIVKLQNGDEFVTAKRVGGVA